MDLEKKETASRRRGDALEEAILDAAWNQLMRAGYSGFTFDSVAKTARTSKPVLYRRWATREALLEAVLEWRGSNDRLTAPATGSLRSDVLGLLREANKRPQRFLALLSAQVGELYGATGLTPRDIRERYIAGGPSIMGEIIADAIARGEVTAARATPRVCALPFDLFRLQLFMTLEALPDAELVSIVDEIFIPLITGLRAPIAPQ